MIKYVIMIRVKNLLTGEIKTFPWQEFDIVPKDEKVSEIISEYKEKFEEKYNESVDFGYVEKIYIV